MEKDCVDMKTLPQDYWLDELEIFVERLSLSITCKDQTGLICT